MAKVDAIRRLLHVVHSIDDAAAPRRPLARAAEPLPGQEPREHDLRARPLHEPVALEVDDQALEVGVIARPHAGDRVGLAGHAPGLDDLGVAAERVGDLVEQGARRVEQLDQRLGVVAEGVVVDDGGEALERAASTA